jgi:hypothetical protein
LVGLEFEINIPWYWSTFGISENFEYDDGNWDCCCCSGCVTLEKNFIGLNIKIMKIRVIFLFD